MKPRKVPSVCMNGSILEWARRAKHLGNIVSGGYNDDDTIHADNGWLSYRFKWFSFLAGAVVFCAENCFLGCVMFFLVWSMIFLSSDGRWVLFFFRENAVSINNGGQLDKLLIFFLWTGAGWYFAAQTKNEPKRRESEREGTFLSFVDHTIINNIAII